MRNKIIISLFISIFLIIGIYSMGIASASFGDVISNSDTYATNIQPVQINTGTGSIGLGRGGGQIEIEPAPVDITTDENFIALQNKYPSQLITSWFDIPLLTAPKALLTLTNHTDTCGVDCLSEFAIDTYQDSPLIDNINFYKINNDNSKTLTNIRNYQIQYYGTITNYETQCIDESRENCTQIEIGSYDDWINYHLGDILPAGSYNIKIIGQKSPDLSIDWVISTQGDELSNWATWGNISTGSQAEVILNSPANNSIQYNNLVTFNATANVTNGATITNMSLWTNSTGSWAINSTSSLLTINVNLAPSASQSTIAGSSTIGGMYFKANRNSTLVTMKVKTGVDANTAYIMSSSTNILSKVSITGGNATFNYPLVNGTTYLIVVNSSSGTYTRNESGAGQTYPVAVTDGNWTLGYYNGNGTSYWDIDKLYITNYSTSSTQLWNNSYSNGTSILWNVQGCDSDGACGFSTSNYTFTIDTVSPQLALNYPSPITNYGIVNGTLQLNYTATDTNPSMTWYNYNGTNSTPTSWVSGTPNLANITLSTKKNITLYANDTAGNLNATIFYWDYAIFENSENYSSSVLSGTNNNFYINYTYNPGFSLANNYLVYNGTSYLATLVSNSNNIAYLLANINVPLTSSTQNYTFYWNLGLTNATGTYNYNTTTNIQSLSPVLFGLCNATINTTTLNFTGKNEDTLSNINFNLQSTINYYTSGGSSTNYLTSIYSGTNNANYSFCLSPSYANLTISGTILYTATGYSTRTYLFNNFNITNSTQNITLLLGNTTLASNTMTLTVVDQSNSAVPNAYIYVQRQNVGGSPAYNTIDVIQTDNTGQASYDVELNGPLYRYIVVVNGNTVLTTNAAKESTTSRILQISTGGTGQYNYFNGIYGNVTYANSTQIVSFTYQDTTGTLAQACLVIYQLTNTSYINYSSDCSNQSAGIITRTIATTNGTFVAEGIATLNAANNNIQGLIQYLYITINGVNPNAVIGKFGGVITILMVVTAAALGAAANSIILGLALVGGAMFFAYWIGFIAFSLYGTGGVLIVIMVMIGLIAYRRIF